MDETRYRRIAARVVEEPAFRVKYAGMPLGGFANLVRRSIRETAKRRFGMLDAGRQFLYLLAAPSISKTFPLALIRLIPCRTLPPAARKPLD